MTDRYDTRETHGAHSDGSESHDARLGAALRELDTPAHREAFFADLERDLAATDERRSRRTRRARTPWWRRWFGGWRMIAVPVTAAALLAALWIWGGPASPTRLWDDLSVKPASAAEVTAKVSAALAAARTLAGDLVVVASDGADGTTEMRWRFVTSARGDFKLTGTHTMADGSVRTEAIAYDAAAGVERSYSQEDTDGPIFAGERSGLAAGGPDQGPSDWVLQRRLGSVVRALLAAQAEDPQVTTVSETTFDGRAAWVLDTPVRRNLIAGLSGDRLQVTVDQETGFPVRVLETLAGALVEETRIEGLTVDSPEAFSADYSLDFPAEAEISRTDVGFRRLDPAALATEAAAVVGYAPLVPTWVPDGYTPAETAVAASGLPTGVEGMNPATQGVVSLAYRRGFDRFVVTTRLVGEDPDAWSDPLASGEGFRDEPEQVAVTAGPFAGTTAELLVDPRATPHLWTHDDTLVVTVSGDLSRAELLQVLASLAPAGGSAAD